MKESYIESYLVRKVKEHGGLCYKFGMDAVKDFLREVFPA